MFLLILGGAILSRPINQIGDFSKMRNAPITPAARGKRLRHAAAKLGFRVGKVPASDYWRIRTKDGDPVIAGTTARCEEFIREQAVLLAA